MKKSKISKISTLRKSLLIGGLIYTFIIVAAYYSNVAHFGRNVFEFAKIQAEAFYEKDIMYRAWASMHGGVYVPVTEKTPPNPLLNVPERDIVTPSGKKLTLMNPAYMTRQVYDLTKTQGRMIGHITSLKPLRKENAPDEWERSALMRFEQGEQEIISMGMIRGKDYVRYIKPFVTTQSCLKCHASQGYSEGDIRGAISVSIPLEIVQQVVSDDTVTHVRTLGIFWVIGIFSLYIVGRLLRREMHTRIQSEERLSIFLEYSSDCVHIIDRNGILIDANNAFYQHLGYKEEECRDMHISVWDTQWDTETLAHKISRLFERGETFETVHTTKEGRLKNVEISVVAAPIGADYYLYCNARDITERKATEVKIKRSEQLFRQIWEQSADGMRLVDAHGFITKVNDAYCKMVGKTREELEGKPLSVIFAPERADSVMEQHRENFSRHRLQHNVEKEVDLWDGRKLWLFVTNSYVLTEGSQLQLFGIFRDITERKKIENELKSYNGLLSSMLENLPFDFWARNTAGKAIIQSREGQKLWGSLLQNTVDDQQVDEETKKYWNQNNEKALRGEIVHARRSYRSIESGDYRTYYEVVAPYYIDGKIAGILGINLDLTEQKSKEEQLAIQSLALESAANGIVITDPDGIIEWVNPAFEALTGYSLSEAKGKNPGSLVKSNVHSKEFYQDMWETISSGHHWTGELVNKRKNGTIYYEEQTITPVFDDNGKIIRYIGIKQDITERKKALEEIRINEERVRALFEQSAVGMMLADLNGNFVKVNKKFCEIVGYPQGEILGMSYKNITHPLDVEEDDANVQKLLNGQQESFVLEKRYVRKDGGIVWANISITMVRDSQKQPLMLSGVVEHISEKKSVEQAMQQLAVFSGESEDMNIFHLLTKKLAQTLQADFTFIGLLSEDQRSINTIAAYRDNTVIQNFTYTLKGTPCENVLTRGTVVYPDNVADQFPDDAVLRQLGINAYIGVSLIDSMGSVRGVVVALSRNQIRYGKEYQSIHTLFAQRAMNEIERIQSIERLRKKEDEFKFLVENSQDVFVRINTRGIITYCSPSILQLGGYTAEQEVGQSVRKYFFDTDQLHSAFRSTIISFFSQTPQREEFLFRTINGSIKWVEAVSKPVVLAGGKKEIIVTIRDMGERKKAEEQIRMNEKLLRNVQTISKIGSYVLDIQGGRWQSSETLDIIFGIETAEYHTVEEWISVIHPDWRSTVVEYLHHHVVEKRNRFDKEYKIVNQRTSEERWVHGQGELEYDGNDKPLKMIGSVQDITDRKRMENALRESEERYRGLVESSMDGFWVVSKEGEILQVNDEYIRMTGFSIAEVVGKNISDFEASELAERVQSHMREVRTKGTDRFESKHRCKNGSTINVEVNTIFLDNQQVFLVFINNITQRKIIEMALRESERRFRSIIENVDLVGIMLDTSANIMLANDYLLRLTGWKREEIDGKNWFDTFIPADHRSAVMKIFDAAITVGNLESRFENEIVAKTGERRLISWNNMFLYDDQNKIIGITCLGEDITARKETEEALLEREEQYRTLVTTMHQGLGLHEVVVDEYSRVVDYRFIDVNESYEKLTGLSRALIVGKTVKEVMPGTEDYWIEQYGKVATTGEPLFYENYSSELNKYFEVVAYRPKPNHFATIITDVTARKRADMKLSASERQYRLLAENSSDVIWTMDLDMTLTYVSPSVYQLRGYLPEEVLRQSVEEMLCPNSVQPMVQLYTRVIEMIRSGEEVPPFTSLIEQPRKDGTTVWAEEVLRVMYDDKKRPIGLLGVTRDITERKRREDLLHTRLRLSAYANNHSVKELLQQILDEAEKITESTIGFFHFVDDDQKTISLQTWSTNTLRNMCKADSEGKHYPVDSAGVWADCIRTKGPVVHNDFGSVEGQKGMPEGHAHVERELLIPIMRNERVVGIMGVGNKEYFYDANDVEIASQLATMAWDILERRRAEISLQNHERALAGLSKAAVALLHMTDFNNDVMIQKALSNLGRGLNADRVYIFENERNGAGEGVCTSMTYEWTNDAVTAEIHNPAMKRLSLETVAPAMWGMLRSGQTYKHFVEDLPPMEAEMLKAQDIKSIVLIPIFSDDHFWGFIGMDSVLTARKWNNDEESVLRVAAESFGIALQRMKAISQLYENEQMLKFALEASGDGIWTLNVPTMEVYFSPEAKRLGGYSDGEFENDFNSWFSKIHASDQQAVIDAMQKHIHGEMPYFVNEHRLLCKDGQYRWMLDRGKILKWTKEGTPLQIFGTYSDIHHRKETEEKIVELNEQLEQKVEKRTQQLRESMQELESFSYSISHDLRAPVRAIDSFAKILAEEEEQKLGDEGKRLLKTVRKNTARMGRMIDDLLQFSRASRAEIKKVPFDMNALVAKVLEESIGAERSRVFKTRINPLPDAYGDPSLLRQVVVNIVSNAVKFTRGRDESLIVVGGSTDEGMNTYWIKDNGTGFDMQYVDKLFGVFQRLHNQQDFEGTGVGLAIVHRILQKHGGSIWAESQVGIGTTFYFSIPHNA